MSNKVKSIKEVSNESVNQFTEFSTQVAKVVTKSQLTIIKTDINRNVESNVKSVSAYFNEFRKNHAAIKAWLKEAHTKGRTFDANVAHDILMIGNMKALLAGSDKIEAVKMDKLGSKYKAPNGWSAARMFASFVAATETTPGSKTTTKVVVTVSGEVETDTF